MKQITTADIRKDAGNWKGQFLVKKMKQGRDKLVDSYFLVTEVDEAFYQGQSHRPHQGSLHIIFFLQQGCRYRLGDRHKVRGSGRFCDV